MSDLYSVRSSGKLKLKGEKKKQHKKDKKAKKRKAEADALGESNKKFREDRARHGGWWSASSHSHITGPIAIEFDDHCYVKALDDGTFTVGTKHDEGGKPEKKVDGIPSFITEYFRRSVARRSAGSYQSERHQGCV